MFSSVFEFFSPVLRCRLKEMMDLSSLRDKNPWADDKRTFGSIRNALLLAERSRHLPKVRQFPH